MRLFAAAAIAAMIGLPSLALAGAQDFTLMIRTGYTVSHVYVSAETPPTAGRMTSSARTCW